MLKQRKIKHASHIRLFSNIQLTGCRYTEILDSAPLYTHTHKHLELGIQNKEVWIIFLFILNKMINLDYRWRLRAPLKNDSGYLGFPLCSYSRRLHTESCLWGAISINAANLTNMKANHTQCSSKSFGDITTPIPHTIIQPLLLSSLFKWTSNENSENHP